MAGSEHVCRDEYGMIVRTGRCIAKRETLLFEAEKEGVACSRRFLSETRTQVDEGDVAGLLGLLDQVRQLRRKENEEGGSSDRNQRVCEVHVHDTGGSELARYNKTVVPESTKSA